MSNTDNCLQPTQKPLATLMPLISTIAPRDGLALDAFAGSGSSLVAAQSLGRSYLGIELDSDYHAIAVAVWRLRTMRPRPVRARALFLSVLITRDDGGQAALAYSQALTRMPRS